VGFSTFWVFVDIAFEPFGVLVVFQRYAIYQSSRAAPSNNTDKHRKRCHTNGNESEVKAKQKWL
jgi:hypothetical protein